MFRLKSLLNNTLINCLRDKNVSVYIKNPIINSQKFFKSQLSPAATNMKETKEISTKENETTSFAKLLKNSPFIQMGDPNGTVVVGTIIETLDDNVYVDFGAKFHCVCKKPRYKTDLYTRGTKVRIRLIDLELASKFMGSDKGITLLEADAVLLGLEKGGASNINQSYDRYKGLRRQSMKASREDDDKKVSTEPNTGDESNKSDADTTGVNKNDEIAK